MNNGSGASSLMLASQNGDLNTVKALIDKGVDVNAIDRSKGGLTAIRLASHKGHLEIVNALLAVPSIDIDVADNNGWNALRVASFEGHLDVVNALIAAGADVNTITDGGWTAFEIASKKGHTDIVNALREAGAKEQNVAWHNLKDLPVPGVLQKKRGWFSGGRKTRKNKLRRKKATRHRR